MRCSVEFAKLPVLCCHGVCWKEAVREAANSEGVVGLATVKSCGRGDGGVDIVPDDFIGLVVKDRSEERYNMLNVEVAGVNC